MASPGRTQLVNIDLKLQPHLTLHLIIQRRILYCTEKAGGGPSLLRIPKTKHLRPPSAASMEATRLPAAMRRLSAAGGERGTKLEMTSNGPRDPTGTKSWVHIGPGWGLQCRFRQYMYVCIYIVL